MVIQYSDGLLNSIAPGLSGFRPFAIAPTGERFEVSRQWVFHFGLNEGIGSIVYTPVLAGALRQYFRRTSAALLHYDLMRKSLEEYFDQFIPDSPKFGKYFTALNSAEICILQIQMAAESLNKSVLRDLKEGKISGPNYDNCFSISNNIKHFGERIQQGRSDSFFPVWFLTEGVTNGKITLTFDALFDVVDNLYQFAIQIIKKNQRQHE